MSNKSSTSVSMGHYICNSTVKSCSSHNIQEHRRAFKNIHIKYRHIAVTSSTQVTQRHTPLVKTKPDSQLALNRSHLHTCISISTDLSITTTCCGRRQLARRSAQEENAPVLPIKNHHFSLPVQVRFACHY